MENLHTYLKIDPLNIRLQKLASKGINKLREQYLCNKDNTIVKPYRFSDFEIDLPPHKTKKRTIALRIKKYIYKSNRIGLLRNCNKPESWKTPSPIYRS